MAVIQSLLAQLAQMTMILLLSPLLTGVVRKVKPLQRRRGPLLIQPYLDLRRLLGEGGGRRECLLAVPRRAVFRLRRNMGCRCADPDVRREPNVQVGPAT